LDFIFSFYGSSTAIELGEYRRVDLGRRLTISGEHRIVLS